MHAMHMAQVTRLSMERDQLDAEYGRMPVGSGKCGAERRRKLEVEGRLLELAQELNALRRQLKAAA